MSDDPVAVRGEYDVYRARALARSVARGVLDEVGTMALATCVSELAWNLVEHATDGGEVRVWRVEGPSDAGVRVEVADNGPGIEDLDRALTDGIGRGLGCGLPGARRLCHEFAIETGPRLGTRIQATRWRCA